MSLGVAWGCCLCLERSPAPNPSTQGERFLSRQLCGQPSTFLGCRLTINPELEENPANTDRDGRSIPASGARIIHRNHLLSQAPPRSPAPLHKIVFIFIVGKD